MLIPIHQVSQEVWVDIVSLRQAIREIFRSHSCGVSPGRQCSHQNRTQQG
jgi:hypothetical protein